MMGSIALEPMCAHPDTLSLVAGHPVTTCWLERHQCGACGPEGVRWEAMPQEYSDPIWIPIAAAVICILITVVWAIAWSW